MIFFFFNLVILGRALGGLLWNSLKLDFNAFDNSIQTHLYSHFFPGLTLCSLLSAPSTSRSITAGFSTLVPKCCLCVAFPAACHPPNNPDIPLSILVAYLWWCLSPFHNCTILFWVSKHAIICGNKPAVGWFSDLFVSLLFHLYKSCFNNKSEFLLMAILRY